MMLSVQEAMHMVAYALLSSFHAWRFFIYMCLYIANLGHPSYSIYNYDALSRDYIHAH